MWVIVLIAICVVLFYILPFIGFFALLYVGLQETSFEVQDNGSIVIGEDELRIDKDYKTYLDETTECYIYEARLTNNSKNYYNYLDIAFSFYDKDDYVLGKENFYLDTLKEDGKWKIKVSYCDKDYKDVTRVEIDTVDLQ